MPYYAMPCRAGLGEGKQAFGVMDIDVFLYFSNHTFLVRPRVVGDCVHRALAKTSLSETIWNTTSCNS